MQDDTYQQFLKHIPFFIVPLQNFQVRFITLAWGQKKIKINKQSLCLMFSLELRAISELLQPWGWAGIRVSNTSMVHKELDRVTQTNKQQ